MIVKLLHRARGHHLRRYEKRWSTTGRCGIEQGGVARGTVCSCGEVWRDR